MPQRRRDRGSATVLAVTIVTVLASVLLGAAAVGAATIARNQAQSAADLAAVAGAQGLIRGWSEAEVCARATRFASSGRARLHRCELVRGPVSGRPEVLVEVRCPVMASSSWTARAVGRAGLVPRGGG